MFPRDIVCLRNISIYTLHKGDDNDDDDDNNNNNNNNIDDEITMLTDFRALTEVHYYNNVLRHKHNIY